MMNKNYNGLKSVKHPKLSLVIVIMFSLIIGSCASSEVADSKDVNQNKIYQYYYVLGEYDNPDTYYVKAQFRFGGNKGTTLKLSEPSKTLANNIGLNEEINSFSGAYYEANISKSNEIEFIFIDTDNKKYSNKCKINEFASVEYKDFDVNSKIEVEWIGPALDNHETMSIYIEDNEKNICTKSTDIKGAKSIIINSDDMQTLKAGSAQYYFVRSYSAKTKEAGDNGGEIFTEYKSSLNSVILYKNEK